MNTGKQMIALFIVIGACLGIAAFVLVLTSKQPTKCHEAFEIGTDGATWVGPHPAYTMCTTDSYCSGRATCQYCPPGWIKDAKPGYYCIEGKASAETCP